jgi:uncharacterized protein involved in outer membrane biogenesis
MRWKWILAICVCLIIALMAAVYVLLRTYDYNKLRPRIEKMVKEVTGRELNLAGDISLAVGFSPALVVTDITFANAPWASQLQMVKIGWLQAQVRLLPLLVRDVELRRVGLKGVDVLLETNPDGQGNWEFAVDESPAKKAGASKATGINIDNIRIENLNLTFHDGKTGSATRFNLTDLKVTRQAAADVLAVDLRAEYSGKPVTLSGTTGLVSEAMASKRFPFKLAGTFSDATVKLEGALDDVIELKGIDVKVQTSGDNLAKLKLNDNIQLPKTSAFDLTGHLKGSKESLALNDLNGNLSGSDVHLAFSGNVGDLMAITGIDLKLQGSGKDLTEIGAIFDQKLPATDEFAIEGRLTGSAKALTLQAARGSARRGSLSIALTGEVKDLIDFSGVDLKVKGSGKDLAEIGAIFDQKLPATDEFAIEGRLTGSAKALTLQAARSSARRGSLSIALTGEVKDLIDFSGADLKVKGSGKDLAEIGAIFDQKLPATDQFAVEARLTGSARSLSLQQAKASANRGSLNLTLNGAIKQLSALEGINFTLKASGKELAEIGPLVGTELPELGPFDMSAKLAGSAKAIALNAFSAIIDKSDFNGQVRVEFLKRPKITMRLESSVIDFTTLLKSLDKDSQKDGQKAVKNDIQKSRLFSDDPLPFEVLKKVDADIDLKAKNIHARDARLKFGHLALKLEDSDLSIDRLEATYKQTKISGSLNINPGAPPRAATHFLVQGFNLGDFLKETGKSDKVRAIVDIAAHGKSSGYSVQGLMTGLDGSIGAVMGEGYLTNYLNLISFNLAHKAREFWGRHEKGDQIKCAVVQFDIHKGIADSRAFVFDTQAGILFGTGKINLGTEKVNFLLVPKPTSFSLSLSTKLRVSGMLMNPKVRPDTLSVAQKGAEMLGALALGPIGLLAPFIRLGAHHKHPCEVKHLGELGLSVPAEK